MLPVHAIKKRSESDCYKLFLFCLVTLSALISLNLSACVLLVLCHTHEITICVFFPLGGILNSTKCNSSLLQFANSERCTSSASGSGWTK